MRLLSKLTWSLRLSVSPSPTQRGIQYHEMECMCSPMAKARTAPATHHAQRKATRIRGGNANQDWGKQHPVSWMDGLNAMRINYSSVPELPYKVHFDDGAEYPYRVDHSLFSRQRLSASTPLPGRAGSGRRSHAFEYASTRLSSAQDGHEARCTPVLLVHES